MKQRLALLMLWVLCQGAALLASVWMLAAIIVGSKRAWLIAVGYDQLANVTTGGHEDETISSRAGRTTNNGRSWDSYCARLCDDY